MEVDLRWWVKSIVVGIAATLVGIGGGFLIYALIPAIGWEIPTALVLALVAIGFLLGALSGTVAATAPPALYHQPEHHPEVHAMAFREELEHIGPGRWNPDMLLAGLVPLITALGLFAYLLLFR
jgi:hypothetical protein